MGEGWNQPWTTPFQAPTDVTQQNDPGWQFRMKEGLGAIQRAAAAKGTLLTGGAMKDLGAWAQDFASNEYDKVYNRALGEYKDAYGIFSNNQNNAFNRPYQLSQLGAQTADAQARSASAYGANSAENATGSANAQASGQAASGAAWGNAIRDIGGTAAEHHRGVPVYPRIESWHEQSPRRRVL